MANRVLLAVDGHDGAGKTTLAIKLAERLRADYVRPFGGAAGARLVEMAARDPEGSVQFAKGLVSEATDTARGDVLVFDRHWMTVSTLIPEALWDVWRPVPPTVLCWADLCSTLARLSERKEKEATIGEHSRYLRLYWDLANRFHCRI